MMSLYIFGLVASRNELDILRDNILSICEDIHVSLSLEEIDDEDKNILRIATDQYLDDGFNRMYFSVYSNPNDTDAVTLWIEAQNMAIHALKHQGIENIPNSFPEIELLNIRCDYYDMVQHCRIAKLIYRIANLQMQNTVISVAIVDGGIENVERFTSKDFVEYIYKLFILNWDCLPNTLSVIMWS